MAKKEIQLVDSEMMAALFGSFDSNMKQLESAFEVRISGRDGTITAEGSEAAADQAAAAISAMSDMLLRGSGLDEHAVRYCVEMVKSGQVGEIKALAGDCLLITAKGKPVKAKTIGQKKYIEAIRKNTIVFGIGPAGTGKTYLAVAAAVKAFKEHEVSRIILTRPAVEAGEKLGFLPGDMQNKVDPYLRPLYDALFDTLGAETFQRLFEKNIIEVAPLAYMRGRTLDDSFIILDEAQNTTSEQMKMFLTRLGNGSRAVITGDITQIDLADGKKSGLIESARILKGIEDIEQIYLTEKDVVRHKLVQEIVKAYERASHRSAPRTKTGAKEKEKHAKK